MPKCSVDHDMESINYDLMKKALTTDGLLLS